MQCQACNSQQFEVLESHLDDALPFSLRKCLNCGLFETGDLLVTSSSLPYRRFNNPLEIVLKFARLWRAFLINLKFRAIVGELNVFDYGCGRGEFINFLKKKGWKTLGCEVNERSALEAKSLGLEVLFPKNEGEIVLLRYPKNSISLITAIHVLEHLGNPKDFLFASRESLSKNGYLLIEVPNILSLQSQISGLRWVHLDVINHRFHFSLNSLINLLDESGLVIESVRMFSIQYGVFGMIDTLSIQLLRGRESCWSRISKKGNYLINILTLLEISVLFFPAFVLEAFACYKKRGGVLRIVAKNANIESNSFDRTSSINAKL